jgi:nitrile hydratase subunit beta
MTDTSARQRFSVGEEVAVRRLFPPGHIRTPRYVMGLRGKISHAVGEFPNPEELAYGRKGFPKKMLYRVRFRQIDVWPGYAGAKDDTLEIELYDHWLIPSGELALEDGLQSAERTDP